MKPTSNYGAVGQQTGTGMTGNTVMTETTERGYTGTGTQEGQKEGLMGKVAGMVGMGGHKEHGHGVVPQGAPSKQDHTLYRKGSSSSSSSSDEEDTRRKEIVHTETLESRGIPRQFPAEHIKEGATALPVQHVRAPVDTAATNVNIPKRYPSEHLYDDKPGMYKGPAETTTVTKGGVVNADMSNMRIGGEKEVTVTGPEADRLEARDRAMGKHIEKEGPGHTHATGTGVGTGIGSGVGTGIGTGYGTGVGTTAARPGVITDQHDVNRVGMGNTATTGTTGVGMTGAHSGTSSGTADKEHGKEHGGLLNKVKNMLPGHHAK